ncbi:MAG TPA: hypothetical protein VNN77_06950 [candidate division Zixibacteria bacterium]|nr:hypothetical protein [candidate division Zixibacteria bacterium]
MNRDWIMDMYRKVKEHRDRELGRIIAILGPKANSDPEIREALRLLEFWMRDEDGSNEFPAAKDAGTSESQFDRKRA